MLKSLSIENFRLFKSLNIDSLNRVNLITGENNSGKTAVLEVLGLLFSDKDSFLTFSSAFRGSQGKDDFDSFWRWLSYGKDLTKPMTIEAINDKGSNYIANRLPLESQAEIITFQYQEGDWSGPRWINKDGNGNVKRWNPDWPTLSIFSAIPSSPPDDADHFSRIAAKRGGDERVVKLLQVIEPRLQDLKYLKLGSQPLIYADVGMEDLIPTTQLGQGFTRLLRLYSEILLAKSKIILIDEIENGIHYTAMPKVWKGIAAIAREEDLQVFATTHSYECIRSAHEAFLSEPHYDLALHRLERDDSGDIQVVTLNRESLDTSFEMEWEVR